MKGAKLLARYNLMPYVISLILLLVFGTLTYSFLFGGLTIQEGNPKTLALILIALTVLMLTVTFKGVCLVLGVGYYYIINQKGIIFSSPFIKRQIFFSSIKEIKKLNKLQVQNLTHSIAQKQVAYPRKLNFKKSVLYAKKYVNINRYNLDTIGYRYFDFSIITKRFGFPLLVKVFKPLVSNNDFIMLHLKDGTKYLLSPRNPEKFLQNYQRNKK